MILVLPGFRWWRFAYHLLLSTILSGSSRKRNFIALSLAHCDSQVIDNINSSSPLHSPKLRRSTRMSRKTKRGRKAKRGRSSFLGAKSKNNELRPLISAPSPYFRSHSVIHENTSLRVTCICIPTLPSITSSHCLNCMEQTSWEPCD